MSRIPNPWRPDRLDRQAAAAHAANWDVKYGEWAPAENDEEGDDE